MTTTRRRYRIVSDEAKTAAVDTVIDRISNGDSFTSACRAVGTQLEVSQTAVRSWVNDSGRRPEPSWDRVRSLEAQLAAATDLNRRLAARLGAAES
ncbi:hypothetical protein [Rhodococcus sp. NPDC058514]|uniref:hypothetical protein n=1 Tax=unclassified Rhodococcus (in: high G+C Gram-positive bacteria) TaxID=192944 RepID=UPI00364690E5